MPPRQTLALPYMLLAAGIGLTGFYTLEWLKLPHYAPSDIEASVELNLQLEMQQRRTSSDDRSQDLQARRIQIRKEVLSDIAQERKAVETGLGAGLIALVAASGNFLLGWLLRRRPRS